MVIQHLTELRKRIIRLLIIFAIVFLCCSQYANTLYQWLALPLLTLLPKGSAMIATEVAAPFLTPFRLSFYISIFLIVPIALQQVWAFIVPGLYPNEKRLVVPLLISSVLLFYFGMMFNYFCVLPLVFGFFIHITPHGVQVMTDINAYLDFIMSMFLAFGLAFQCPVVTCLIIRLGLISTATLRDKRPYVIIACFVIAMFLTPPDVVSQTLLAVPLWLLFELGLMMSKLTTPKALSIKPAPQSS